MGLEDVPDDLLVNIFSLLDGTDWLRILRISRRFHQMIKRNLHWLRKIKLQRSWIEIRFGDSQAELFSVTHDDYKANTSRFVHVQFVFNSAFSGFEHFPHLHSSLRTSQQERIVLTEEPVKVEAEIFAEYSQNNLGFRLDFEGSDEVDAVRALFKRVFEVINVEYCKLKIASSLELLSIIGELQEVGSLDIRSRHTDEILLPALQNSQIRELKIETICSGRLFSYSVIQALKSLKIVSGCSLKEGEFMPGKECAILDLATTRITKNDLKRVLKEWYHGERSLKTLSIEAEENEGKTAAEAAYQIMEWTEPREVNELWDAATAVSLRLSANEELSITLFRGSEAAEFWKVSAKVVPLIVDQISLTDFFATGAK